ncbi:lasso peptide biosynthesis B2 protein [Nostoc sp. TCL26-01]|uniref:lasso peptide biosynthesis B2 protein n=1 Tax=Nostoc sp. TCL26-01 TaxID=2576904 RepID=UPI0015B9EE8F|nr:lasso peptide biosynthesis B2 protein [Nostoc sp. TCL26-01]QLE58686.1 lasso peptide biosynthesis B2 protein [Nostoc sp. TCL26-01]
MKLLCKLFRFNDQERQLLISAFTLLGLVNIGLRILPFRILKRLVDQISKPNARLAQIPINMIIWAVDVSTKYIPGGAKCLARALTCQILMARRGYTPELRIGVTKSEEGQFQAHAWIESQGQVVIGQLTNLSSYTPLPSLPRNGL